MVDNKIEIKQISDLLEMNFFIPSYQRGYRWTNQEVNDLLDDILEFIISDPKKDDWYCLQPIVVKPKGESWEVIDGQQRLTTIFLILLHLGKYVESERKNFVLEYETRNTKKSNSKEFLLKINEKTEQESLVNIDYDHIYKAYHTITNWFTAKAKKINSVSSKFITPFLEKTKVIWYITNEEDTVKIFTRLNMGKIPLTNAELIKALFLNSSNFKNDTTNEEKVRLLQEEKIRLKQLEIASEWDFIEYSLQNDELWWFINKDENEKNTRIEFIFELIVGKPKNNDDDTYTFREYYKRFKMNSESQIEENWKMVKRHFQTLQDWFDDRILYHKIGFLVTTGADIKTLITESHKITKTTFNKIIDDKIIELFKKAQLSKIEYGNGIIRPLLLLHNIQTMLNNKKENSRFPFHRYKKENWDIEHIHAIATEMPGKQDQREDWLKYAIELLESMKPKNDENKEIIEKFKKDCLNYDENTFKQLYNDIVEFIGDENTNSLYNLALLDSGTNRGYKNEFFSFKRKSIIDREKKGTFIPICTKNVFMKYYSQKIEQMTFWGELDKKEYLDNIIDVLSSYLPVQKE
jgi:hypothetical protein